MSQKITNDAGEEIDVFTQAELDAKLSEKDDAHKKKIDEFMQGKTAQELASIDNKKAIEDMQKLHAEEIAGVKTLVTSAETKARTKVVEFLVAQVVGENPDLKKKLSEEMATIEAGFKAQGKDINDDVVIQEIVIKAAVMAGITAAAAPHFAPQGGYAPDFGGGKKEGAGSGSDQDNEAFKKAVGYKDEPKKAV